LGSLEDNFPYTLMGESNLMLYPYITLILRMLSPFSFRSCPQSSFEAKHFALIEATKKAGLNCKAQPSIT
jgi:hypothetical protein